MTFKLGYIPWNKGKSSGMKGRHHTKESKDKISKGNDGHTSWCKGLTKETDKRIELMAKKVSNTLTGRKLSVETKEKLSNILTGRERSKEHKKHLSEALTGNHPSNETCLKMRESHLGKHPSEEARQKMRQKRLARVLPQKDTTIEILLQKELDRRNIIYKKHIPICNCCQPDIVFLEKKIAVFADGDYWHNRPEMIEKDNRQNKVLEENGWTIYRFWEHDIKNSPKNCINKVVGELI